MNRNYSILLMGIFGGISGILGLVKQNIFTLLSGCTFLILAQLMSIEDTLKEVLNK